MTILVRKRFITAVIYNTGLNKMQYRFWVSFGHDSMKAMMACGAIIFNAMVSKTLMALCKLNCWTEVDMIENVHS